MQNNVEKDAVDLEAGKVHLILSSVRFCWYQSNGYFPTHNTSISIPVIFIFIFFHFGKSSSAIPEERKNTGKKRQSCLSLFCGPSISQIRKLKFFMENEECKARTGGVY